MLRKKIKARKCVVVILMILSVPILHAQSAKPALSNKYVGIGYSSDLISGADVRDIKAALKIWADELIKDFSLDYKAATFIFNSMESYTTAIKNGQVNLASLPSLYYLQIRDKLHLQPALVGSENGKRQNKYVILASKKSAIKQLRDLKGKRLLTLSGAKGKISQMWLEILLHKKGLGAKESFFSNIKETKKGSQAILPVFFRQADCCVVTQNAFEAMAELNPQIGEDLFAIATSPPYLCSIFCFSSSIDNKSKNAILKTALNLSNSENGKQVLTLFRLNDIVAYKPSFLTNIEALFREHQKLAGVIK